MLRTMRYISRQVGAAQAVAEARVLGAVKHQVDQAVLADVAQALKLPRVDEALDEPSERPLGPCRRGRREIGIDAIEAELAVHGSR